MATRVLRWVSVLTVVWLGLAAGCAPTGEEADGARVAVLDPGASTASLTYFSPEGALRFDAAVEGELALQWQPGPDGAPEVLLQEMALEVGAATVDGLTLHGAELWLSEPLRATPGDDGRVAFERAETAFGLAAVVEVVTVEQELQCAHALQGTLDEGLVAWGVSMYTPGEPFAARLELEARSTDP